jgi:hypothetical protein
VNGKKPTWIVRHGSRLTLRGQSIVQLTAPEDAVTRTIIPKPMRDQAKIVTS